MAEKENMSAVVDEIKNATEDELRKVIEEWLEKTRTSGMILGAKYIAAGVFGAIQKHLNKQNPSLRDYERCMKDIRKIIAVPLTQKKDLEEEHNDTNDNPEEQEEAV
jgi:hypothetical protein